MSPSAARRAKRLGKVGSLTRKKRAKPKGRSERRSSLMRLKYQRRLGSPAMEAAMRATRWQGRTEAKNP